MISGHNPKAIPYVKLFNSIEMKKLILALAILASSTLFVSCTADDTTDETNKMSLQADESGGNNTTTTTKPPPPPLPPTP